MRESLVPPVWRVASHRPADRIMRSRIRTTPIFQVSVHLVEAGFDAIELRQVVLPAEWSTFPARSVVGQEHEDRVIENSVLLQTGDESSNLVVGMGERARGDLHLPRHK